MVLSSMRWRPTACATEEGRAPSGYGRRVVADLRGPRPGRILDPLIGRGKPPADRVGFGLWLANQLCDLVQIRSFPTGSWSASTSWPAGRRRVRPGHLDLESFAPGITTEAVSTISPSMRAPARDGTIRSAARSLATSTWMIPGSG